MKKNKPNQNQLEIIFKLLNNKLHILQFIYNNKRELEKIDISNTYLNIISLQRELSELIYKTLIHYQVEINTTNGIYVFKKDTEYAIKSRGGIEFTDLKKVNGIEYTSKTKPKTLYSIFKNPLEVDKIELYFGSIDEQ